jgi:polysaccharide biosynthesis protein PslH
MRILVVLVSDLAGRASGHSRVIRGALRSLVGLGHDIHVVAISETAPEPVLPEAVTLESLPPPHVGRVMASVVRYATTARLSLNECLYWSPSLARRVRRIAAEYSPDMLLADTIRAFPLAAASGFPVVADLEDLLSARYTSLSNASVSSRNIALGAYRRRLPRALQAPAAFLATSALRVESRLLDRREVQIARRAAAVCLVSGLEAAELGAKARRQVFCTPPAIPVIHGDRSITESPDWTAVHVGGLDFGPNIQAMRWFRTEVVPLLADLSGGTFRVSMVGYCPPDLRAELHHPSIEFLGYLENIEPVLGRNRTFVAPVVSGAGLKIKVLDAMAHGMPVVATAKAVEGLPVKDRVHAHLADTAAEFARRLHETAADGRAAAALGEAGRSLVAREFSPDRAMAAWRSAIASLAVQTFMGDAK